jgi:hypothetical protein
LLSSVLASSDDQACPSSHRRKKKEGKKLQRAPTAQDKTISTHHGLRLLRRLQHRQRAQEQPVSVHARWRRVGGAAVGRAAAAKGGAKPPTHRRQCLCALAGPLDRGAPAGAGTRQARPPPPRLRSRGVCGPGHGVGWTHPRPPPPSLCLILRLQSNNAPRLRARLSACPPLTLSPSPPPSIPLPSLANTANGRTPCGPPGPTTLSAWSPRRRPSFSGSGAPTPACRCVGVGEDGEREAGGRARGGKNL